MRNCFSTVALTLTVATVVNGFVPRTLLFARPPAVGPRYPSALSSSSDHDSNSPLARNSARTCVKNFLTQRSIQSFMFLLEQCRDQPTIRWLHSIYGWKNLLNFHGTGAFNMTVFGTWDSVLTDMMSRPADKVVVSVAQRAGRGRGGWSKNNPYLEEDRFVEFQIDIDPISLASRIMSVREQLAAEWKQDFDTIIRANELILTSYFDKVMDARDDEEEYNPDADHDEEEHDEPEHNLDTHSLTAPYSAQKPAAAFDRNSMQMLLDETAFEPVKSSPLRKGNFDLMILLSTQESIHRVLHQYKEADKGLQFEWLLDFYTERLEGYFDGNQQSYGRADDFLEELLLSPPSVKKIDGTVGLIDPLGVAEEIIRTRGDVSREWKEAMSLVPEEHMELRRELLARQMGRALEPQTDGSEGGANFASERGGGGGNFE